jgi:hypothetical protein
VVAWLGALPAYRQHTTLPLAELVLGKILGRAFALTVLALSIWAAVGWRHVPGDSPRFFLLFAFILAAPVAAISSGIAVYDQVLLRPALLWLWSTRRAILRASQPVRCLAVMRSGALMWPSIAAPALLVAWRFVPRAHTYRAILLPLTTATSFPLVTLILLGVFVAQAVRRELTAKDGARAGARSLCQARILSSCFLFFAGRFFTADRASAR